MTKRRYLTAKVPTWRKHLITAKPERCLGCGGELPLGARGDRFHNLFARECQGAQR